MVNIKYAIVLLSAIIALSVTSCAAQGVTLNTQESIGQSYNNSAKGEESSESSPDEDQSGNNSEDREPEEEKSLLVDITMEGGSGKAHIQSPVEIIGTGDDLKAILIWSSSNYDYMIVDGIRYDNENSGGNSTFTIPVNSLDEPLAVIADTVAMSTPHEIEYTIYWGKVHAEGQDETGTSNTKDAALDPDNTDKNETDGAKDGSGISGRPQAAKPARIGQYSKTGELELEYATQFSVSSYGNLKLISIVNSGDYLVVPGNCDIPDDIPEGITVLKQPLDKTYLVSTSAMDLVCECGALDMLKYSGTKAEDWYVEKAKEAMEKRRILYAGKYRAPDYELILSGGCNFAIENTMIYHNPEVKEKLEELGIPVLVETSSYEGHPLGRLEWIKLYGILFGTEEKAVAYYDKQLKELDPVMGTEKPGIRVAFFHMTATGLINVRKPGDYISTMIGLAGGEYVFSGSEDGKGNSGNEEDSSSTSSMNMQMEDFYAAAHDADILIYNSTITGEIHSADELIKKSPLFKDFKAVKNGRVYCTKPGFFQKTTGIADFMKDLNNIFNGRDDDLTYLTIIK